MPLSFRQAFLQLCCAGRPPEAGQRVASAIGSSGGGSQVRRLCRTFGEEADAGGPLGGAAGDEEAAAATPICIEYEAAVGGDADEFDAAFQSCDLQALVRLLRSTQPVVRLSEPKHQWAEDPRTVGALVAVLLAHLASTVVFEDSRTRIQICEAGAIAELISFLRSAETDRVQHAVVALNYLTDECTANARTAFEAGAMPLLIQHLQSEIPGMRGAAASTLRHICVQSEEYCEIFIKLGGMEGFVQQLDFPLDPSLDHDLMLEAVWNLEDITTDRDGRLIERYAKLANERGALEKLERLKDVGEDEVRSAAEKVLAALSQVN